MFTSTHAVILIIVSLIFVAGTTDFLLKEVHWQKIKKRGGSWDEMPKVFEHKYGWWIWITCIWALPLIYLSAYNKLFYAGFILFSLEDAIYFFWKKLIYKKIDMKNFNYLLPPLMRKFDLTPKIFWTFISLQIIIFIVFMVSVEYA